MKKYGFALRLENCSESDRLKVIKTAEENNRKWWDDDSFEEGFKGKPWVLLKIGADGDMYYTQDSGCPLYDMPGDWDQILAELKMWNN